MRVCLLLLSSCLFISHCDSVSFARDIFHCECNSEICLVSGKAQDVGTGKFSWSTPVEARKLIHRVLEKIRERGVEQFRQLLDHMLQMVSDDTDMLIILDQTRENGKILPGFSRVCLCVCQFLSLPTLVVSSLCFRRKLFLDIRFSFLRHLFLSCLRVVSPPFFGLSSSFCLSSLLVGPFRFAGPCCAKAPLMAVQSICAVWVTTVRVACRHPTSARRLV